VAVCSSLVAVSRPSLTDTEESLRRRRLPPGEAAPGSCIPGQHEPSLRQQRGCWVDNGVHPAPLLSFSGSAEPGRFTQRSQSSNGSATDRPQDETGIGHRRVPLLTPISCRHGTDPS
jgi:hypothetical protein